MFFSDTECDFLENNDLKVKSHTRVATPHHAYAHGVSCSCSMPYACAAQHVECTCRLCYILLLQLHVHMRFLVDAESDMRNVCACLSTGNP